MTNPTIPLGSPAESAGELYYPTPVTPEDAFVAIGKLRRAARAEIERLIDWLDTTDDYVSRELEIDDEPEPGGDDELALGSQDAVTDQAKAWNHTTDYFMGDCEKDDADDEPSLAAFERHPSTYGHDGYNPTGDQTEWEAGRKDDTEDEHDGGEPENEGGGEMEDDEPSLGWGLNGENGNTQGTDREQGTPTVAPQGRTSLKGCITVSERGYGGIMDVQGLTEPQRTALKARKREIGRNSRRICL